MMCLSNKEKTLMVFLNTILTLFAQRPVLKKYA